MFIHYPVITHTISEGSKQILTELNTVCTTDLDKLNMVWFKANDKDCQYPNGPSNMLLGLTVVKSEQN